ncbi:MAG TPA: adenine deaminase, partial [Sedimenticola thiotaurini]|nr:adenine deaminase [Sedimenticola thiotaurini]
VCCLSEMMNWPGVLRRDPGVMEKIGLATRLGRPVDGHAPGLQGAEAAAYAGAGISTDHECVSLAEARDKIAAGMHVLIREGSAARNFDTLHPLIAEAPDRVMFCSDDKHPDDLLRGHVNQMVRRAVAAGHDLFDVLDCAWSNPIAHYRLPLGRLRPGDPMDAVQVPDLRGFEPARVWLGGELVARDGGPLLPHRAAPPVNRFHARPLVPEDLRLPPVRGAVRVIGVEDGSLVTRELRLQPRRQQGRPLADPERDQLLICVVNRYRPEPPAVALVQGFGLRRGAIASSVAHDSHNIVGVGADPAALCAAVNRIIECRGGVAVATGADVEILPLPVAGIMSDGDGRRVGHEYARLDRLARDLGSPLAAPFMTLSFMALLVIPELKLSDRGLFDGRAFRLVELAV